MLLRATLIIAAAAGCAASPAEAAVDFGCSVEGAAMLQPAANAEAVCARIKAGIDQALGTVTRANKTAGESGGDWVAVKVRFSDRGVASAQARRGRGGQVTMLPMLNVAVMDRALALDTVDQLARDLGGQLRAAPGNQSHQS